MKTNIAKIRKPYARNDPIPGILNKRFITSSAKKKNNMDIAFNWTDEGYLMTFEDLKLFFQRCQVRDKALSVLDYESRLQSWQQIAEERGIRIHDSLRHDARQRAITLRFSFSGAGQT